MNFSPYKSWTTRLAWIPLFVGLLHASMSRAADAQRGASVYKTTCGACHAPDANGVGPKHRGVVGRKAGSVSDFKYSKAFVKADFVWTENLLDRWISNPEDLLPGQAMGFRLANPTDREDVIAYLKTLN